MEQVLTKFTKVREAVLSWQVKELLLWSQSGQNWNPEKSPTSPSLRLISMHSMIWFLVEEINGPWPTQCVLVASPSRIPQLLPLLVVLPTQLRLRPTSPTYRLISLPNKLLLMDKPPDLATWQMALVLRRNTRTPRKTWILLKLRWIKFRADSPNLWTWFPVIIRPGVISRTVRLWEWFSKNLKLRLVSGTTTICSLWWLCVAWLLRFFWRLLGVYVSLWDTSQKR